jgi:hypothetical protein
MDENAILDNGKTKWSDLWKLEDWWAIWFSAILLFSTVIGIVTKVPKIGKWSQNPIEAIPADLLIPLFILLISIGILLFVGIAIMKTEKLSQYIAGFIGVFVLAVISYIFANQVDIK